MLCATLALPPHGVTFSGRHRLGRQQTVNIGKSYLPVTHGGRGGAMEAGLGLAVGF